MDTANIARRVLEIEGNAILETINDLGKEFDNIVTLLYHCKGKVIITGMGKSGHVARKVAATMSSLGKPAIFLHPGEAMHGDLGIVQQQDIVIAISYSGESDEIINILPNMKEIGVKLIAMTWNENSTLARNSDIVQIFHHVKEACYLGLAPTTSTTIAMAYGDAISVALSQMKKFRQEDFGLLHPAGSLGKRLIIRVADLMQRVSDDELVNNDDFLKDVVISFGKSGREIVAVVNQKKCPIGFITNGQIERLLNDGTDIYSIKVSGVMMKDPIYIDQESMAIEALELMLELKISSAIVVNEEKVVGILSKNKITEFGIYV